MPKKITIDPVTRIEGHLKIEVLLDGGVVQEAKSSGTLYRGLERILKGREPKDANHITQRICGVCPVAHATASALTLDDAFGIAEKIPANGCLIRNLIFGANYVHNSILHFYHLAALDYVDVAKVKDSSSDIFKNFLKRSVYGPLLPQYRGDYRLSDELTSQLLHHYVEGLDFRRTAQEMLTIFGGKMPHNVGIVPGGANTQLTADKVTSFMSKLSELRAFIDNVYLPDVFTVGEAYEDYLGVGTGCGNLLTFGAFDRKDGGRAFVAGRVSEDNTYRKIDVSKITEEVANSWYGEDGAEDYSKEGAYSWIKSPRYGGEVYEVGPLARVMVGYANGDSRIKQLVDESLDKLKLSTGDMFSVMGRHLARAIEAKYVVSLMDGWIEELELGEPVYYGDYSVPAESKGIGFTDAPRGSLGHWIEIKDGKISNYRVISPTTWNGSPMDSRKQPGPLENSLIGTKVKDEENPLELVRIVRSFDPCLACAVHMVSMNGEIRGSINLL